MKKGIAVASAVAVIAVSGAFVANKVTNDKPEDETTTYNYSEQYYDEDNDYGNDNNKVDNETKETTENKESSKADILKLEDLLLEIKEFPYGTAGSSSKAVIIAVDLINYAENTTDSEDTIKDKFNSFKREMSSARYEEYLDNLYAIDDYVKDLYNGENKDFFEDIDYTIQTEDGKFSIEKVQKYFVLFGGE